jgi:hypothetical protein
MDSRNVGLYEKVESGDGHMVWAHAKFLVGSGKLRQDVGAIG